MACRLSASYDCLGQRWQPCASLPLQLLVPLQPEVMHQRPCITSQLHLARNTLTINTRRTPCHTDSAALILCLAATSVKSAGVRSRTGVRQATARLGCFAPYATCEGVSVMGEPHPGEVLPASTTPGHVLHTSRARVCVCVCVCVCTRVHCVIRNVATDTHSPTVSFTLSLTCLLQLTRQRNAQRRAILRALRTSCREVGARARGLRMACWTASDVCAVGASTWRQIRP